MLEKENKNDEKKENAYCKNKGRDRLRSILSVLDLWILVVSVVMFRLVVWEYCEVGFSFPREASSDD